MARLVVAVLLYATTTRGRRLAVSRHMSLEIGDALCDARDYGAVLDGATDDTAALQRALDACGAAGGGVVLVTGPLLMYSVSIEHSRVELRVEGSLILGDRESYYAKTGNASGVVIIENGADDVALTGGGVVDGRGQEWWAHTEDYRPHMLQAENSTRLLLHNITFLDPPNHCLELYVSFVELSRVSVLAPPSTGIAPSDESHNTDAYDVHGDYAYVHECNFTTGDDDVAFHANHTLVEDSYFGTGHGASVGSLCDDWLTNITVRRITFHNTTAGCRIKTHANCGGRVWDVRYEDLTMEGVEWPFEIDMAYGDPGKRNATTMVIEDVLFRNVVSRESHYDGKFMCAETSPCRLAFDDVVMPHVGDSWKCWNGTGSECCAAARGTFSGVVPEGLVECLGGDGVTSS